MATYHGKERTMAKITRAMAAVALVIAGLCTTGCLHTWTQTYQDYPPSAAAPYEIHRQENPSDG